MNPELVDDSDMPTEIAQAFRFYLHSSNANGYRSLAETAKLTHLSINTIRSWHTRYSWSSRARSLDRLTDQESFEVATSRAAQLRPDIVETFRSIMVNAAERTRDRIAAATRLAIITGLMPGTPPVVVTLSDSGASSLDPAALAQLSPAQLLSLLRGGDALPSPPSAPAVDAGPALPPPPDSDPLP